jgi:hypothetical protein
VLLFFTHICQLVNVGEFLFKISPILQKPYQIKDFLYRKKNKKSAKPMGKHWRTNSATLSNFAL